MKSGNKFFSKIFDNLLAMLLLEKGRAIKEYTPSKVKMLNSWFRKSSAMKLLLVFLTMMVFQADAETRITKLRNVAENRPLRILSLDGGGIRGILELTWLDMLEKEIKKVDKKARICDMFDLFVGTSTGGIIAAGLAAGFEVEKIFKLYKKNGSSIFDKGIYYKIAKFMCPSSINRPTDASLLPLMACAYTYGDTLMGSYITQSYSHEGLEALLKKEFKDIKLADLPKPVFITGTELACDGSYKLHIFNSIEAESDSQYNLPVREVLRITSAAPTYFSRHTIVIGDRKRVFVDGGIMANDPTYVVFEKLNEYLGKEYCDVKDTIVSLGTGRYHDEQDHMHGEGKIEWGEPIINAMMQQQIDFTHSVMKKLLKEQYYRLDAQLTKNSSGLDNISQDNIEMLQYIAITAVEEGDQKGEFKRIVDFLTGNDR